MQTNSSKRFNPKIVVAFFGLLASLLAQDATLHTTPDVARVGSRLACRCGSCRNTVGDCPMLSCRSASPKRAQIFESKRKGLSDDEIVNAFVREEGIVALSSPPNVGIGPVLTWIMPGVMLLLGFFVYSWYVRRNTAEPQSLRPLDQAVLNRYKAQIDRELES